MASACSPSPKVHLRSDNKPPRPVYPPKERSQHTAGVSQAWPSSSLQATDQAGTPLATTVSRTHADRAGNSKSQGSS